MKLFNLALVSLMFVSLSASAILRPGWQRPIMSARMTELSSNGQTINDGYKKVMTLHKLDESKKATQISFKEEQSVMCPMIYIPGYRCPSFIEVNTVFTIESIKTDSCGKKTYVARELMDGRITRSSAVLTLQDFTQDRCEYVVHSTWFARIANIHGVRSFRGNAEAVYTIQ